MEPSTLSPQGGFNDSGSRGWLGGGCGGLAGYGPQWVEPGPVSVYPWWEQPWERMGYWLGPGMVRTLDKASDSIIRLWA